MSAAWAIALEAAGLLALAGVLGAAGIKMNQKANADIRASAAQDRMASALERAYPVKPVPSPEPIPEPCGSDRLSRFESASRRSVLALAGACR